MSEIPFDSFTPYKKIDRIKDRQQGNQVWMLFTLGVIVTAGQYLYHSLRIMDIAGEIVPIQIQGWISIILSLGSILIYYGFYLRYEENLALLIILMKAITIASPFFPIIPYTELFLVQDLISLTIGILIIILFWRIQNYSEGMIYRYVPILLTIDFIIDIIGYLPYLLYTYGFTTTDFYQTSISINYIFYIEWTPFIQLLFLSIFLFESGYITSSTLFGQEHEYRVISYLLFFIGGLVYLIPGILYLASIYYIAPFIMPAKILTQVLYVVGWYVGITKLDLRNIGYQSDKSEL